MHYFNEFDPSAAAWLRELMAEGLIPKGIVDERSITEVRPEDLAGFSQCHFFAGIGGWSLALRLAGWPDDRPCWTGSCPCQPYSAAGKGLGDADPRNLWPEFFRLIRKRRPECVFGEQVESAIRHGWLDGVSADLEGEGYAVGAVVLGAHSVGSPHIRQRLFWVADAGGDECRARRDGGADAGRTAQPAGLRTSGRLAHTDGTESGSGQLRLHAIGGSSDGDAEHTTSDGRLEGRAGADGRSTSSRCGSGGLVYPGRTGPQGHAGDGDDGDEPRRDGADAAGHAAEAGGVDWSDSRIIVCRDGKARRIPTQPSLFPLAHGVSGRVAVVRPGVEGEPAVQAEGDVRYVSRVAALRGAGNAIVPEAAAEFIRAFVEVK